ncbi:MAG: hypothetical protein QOC59_834 [Microbacteriaceae bacterium]|nr:hypothetical protein [Microbacteriaceae bacterium]
MSDPDTPGPDDAGTTGPDLAAADTLRTRAESVQTVTNDAVAGETVEPGLGDANQGPTGGSPREAEPILPDNELAGQDVDLDDER